jgi:hypothetical protein
MFKQLLVALTLTLAVLAAPSRAEAKGLLFYNTGEEAFAAGPLPEPFDKVPELAGYEAGYLCSIKGVMWSYFSVSNCRPVAFKGDTYTDEPELVAAISSKYKESDMKKGLWGGYGWMLLLAGAAAGGVIWLLEQKKALGSKSEAPASSETEG